MPTLPLGAYTLHVTWLSPGTDGLTALTRQQRHFTIARRIESANLPENWPFGFHSRPFEPGTPPVGLKMHRAIVKWYNMERQQGQYNWGGMDVMAQRARDGGYGLMYCFEGTPKWASPHPELPDAPKPGVKTFWGYPPTDDQYIRNFLTAFLERYDPQKDASVIQAIEVLNEPMAGHSIAYTPQEYADLCKVVYEIVKAYNPAIQVVGISHCGGLHMKWVNETLDAGAGRYMDVASTHLYEINTPLGDVSVESKVRLLREALDKRGHSHVRIWNTEVGVSSWGRWGEAIVPASIMERRARNSPHWLPDRPHQLRGRWRTQNELLSSGYMVRSNAQQVVLGVERIFYFKWQADVFSWIHDWEEVGNAVPKLMIPVQSVLSEFWLRYAGLTAGHVTITSPDPAHRVFAHTFTGPEGRMTVIYAQPRKGVWSVGDELAGLSRKEGEVSSTEADITALPDQVVDGQPYLDVQLPVGTQPVYVTDILARQCKTLTPTEQKIHLKVGLVPVYVLETKEPLPAWLTDSPQLAPGTGSRTLGYGGTK